MWPTPWKQPRDPHEALETRALNLAVGACSTNDTKVVKDTKGMENGHCGTAAAKIQFTQNVLSASPQTKIQKVDWG